VAPCFDCGAPAQHEHHVVPRSCGGTRTVPLCERCHGLVHNKRFTGIGHLTRKALAAKKAKGERVGRVPYGWQLGADGVLLERCEAEQAVIALCQKLRNEGRTLAAIGAELERQGIRPRFDGAGHPAQIPRVTKPWHPMRVLRLLEAAEKRQAEKLKASAL
jgi:hypothetical protein